MIRPIANAATLSVLLVVLLVGLSACEQRDDAQTAPPPATRSASKVENARVPEPSEPEPAFHNPLLWRVTGPDTDEPSFLFGTIHGGIDVHWRTLPGSVREAIESSDRVVLEAQVDAMSSSKLAGRMMLDEGESLKQALGEERFVKLSEMSDYPPEVLDRLRPWIVHSTVVQKWLGRHRPLDLRISTFAEARDKELGYVEEIEDQIALLDDAIDFDILAEMVDEAASQQELLREAVDAYRRGDEEKLVAGLFDPADVKKHPELYRKLFDERNEAWIPTIEGMMKKDQSFIAVGVGHLVGPGSVVTRLRDRGWTVERTTQ